MPIIGQLRESSGFSGRYCPLGTNREINPASALRASAGKTCIVPPGTHQGIMNGRPIRPQTKINSLHSLSTTGMRTIFFGVKDMGGHVAVLSSLPVNSVHVIQFLSRGTCEFRS